MGRFIYKVEGGKLIKATVDVSEGKLLKVRITGDFFLHPESTLECIEEVLVGLPVDEEVIAGAIENLFERTDVQSIGCTPADFAHTVFMAARNVS